MDRRSFTVSEANRALPLVRRIAADAMRVWREHAECREEAEDLRKAGASEGARSLLAALEEKLRRISGELRGYAAECEELSCRLEDPRTGAIGFPSVLDDRPVVLCWRPGDSRVEHWHEVDEDGSSRKPLPVVVPGR